MCLYHIEPASQLDRVSAATSRFWPTAATHIFQWIEGAAKHNLFWIRMNLNYLSAQYYDRWKSSFSGAYVTSAVFFELIFGRSIKDGNQRIIKSESFIEVLTSVEMPCLIRLIYGSASELIVLTQPNSWINKYCRSFSRE